MAVSTVSSTACSVWSEAVATASEPVSKIDRTAPTNNSTPEQAVRRLAITSARCNDTRLAGNAGRRSSSWSRRSSSAPVISLDAFMLILLSSNARQCGPAAWASSHIVECPALPVVTRRGRHVSRRFTKPDYSMTMSSPFSSRAASGIENLAPFNSPEVTSRS